MGDIYRTFAFSLSLKLLPQLKKPILDFIFNMRIEFFLSADKLGLCVRSLRSSLQQCILVMNNTCTNTRCLTRWDKECFSLPLSVAVSRIRILLPQVILLILMTWDYLRTEGLETRSLIWNNWCQLVHRSKSVYVSIVISSSLERAVQATGDSSSCRIYWASRSRVTSIWSSLSFPNAQRPLRVIPHSLRETLVQEGRCSFVRIYVVLESLVNCHIARISSSRNNFLDHMRMIRIVLLWAHSTKVQSAIPSMWQCCHLTWSRPWECCLTWLHLNPA